VARVRARNRARQPGSLSPLQEGQGARQVGVVLLPAISGLEQQGKVRRLIRHTGVVVPDDLFVRQQDALVTAAHPLAITLGFVEDVDTVYAVDPVHPSGPGSTRLPRFGASRQKPGYQAASSSHCPPPRTHSERGRVVPRRRLRPRGRRSLCPRAHGSARHGTGRAPSRRRRTRARADAAEQFEQLGREPGSPAHILSLPRVRRRAAMVASRSGTSTSLAPAPSCLPWLDENAIGLRALPSNWGGGVPELIASLAGTTSRPDPSGTDPTSAHGKLRTKFSKWR
jgi:hypothetical protein